MKAPGTAPGDGPCFSQVSQPGAGRSASPPGFVAAFVCVYVAISVEPLSDLQPTRLDALIPIYATATIACDSITAVLLFAQFSIWRFGFPCFVIVYALTKEAAPGPERGHAAISRSVGLTGALVARPMHPLDLNELIYGVLTLQRAHLAAHRILVRAEPAAWYHRPLHAAGLTNDNRSIESPDASGPSGRPTWTRAAFSAPARTPPRSSAASASAR